jgi:hypothetical protein
MNPKLRNINSKAAYYKLENSIELVYEYIDRQSTIAPLLGTSTEMKGRSECSTLKLTASMVGKRKKKSCHDLIPFLALYVLGGYVFCSTYQHRSPTLSI